VIVSNEVGLGLVPETKLGRDFRDAQGRANREVARACDAVVLVTAGLPTLIKPASPPALRLR
jgi:adenosylcobinamide kinase/adenosylcobinamide-phosphate guanylyltransferase